MFQISRRADYAVRLMLELGLEPDESLSVRQLSVRTNVPKPFLHKITVDLVRAGLVQTQSGPNGGLKLNRPVDQINMQQILEAVEGPICLNTCLLRPNECERDLFCPAHTFWGALQKMVVQQLQKATLAYLLEEARNLTIYPRRRADIPYLNAPVAGLSHKKEVFYEKG